MGKLSGGQRSQVALALILAKQPRLLLLDEPPPPSCMQALAHFRGFLTYQPADRYWTFQGIEAGIFLVLAGALIAITAVTLLRRDA